ncbi:hypothetical protein DUI87_33703 [Hirundo rustica rustica]|uniref:G-protein coupled receptors family 1 profile domain-containing protein n=1 Tax=Hirundo rustica rustica TaxID=333673 RepID=A0A3M0ILU2_HIRRU|nr:hypothetical protein DUI87_33701 [Hirundo rustica rustica]RMB89929.1 hypothetical protein DUI87_33703 [Hirundo rustica rustica]
MPEKVAIMHIKAHQKVSSELEKGNELADREAKEAARGEITVEGALIPDGWISPKVHDADSDEMSNSSSISHFLLLPLADTRQLQLLHFCLFLGISLAALLANGLIISAVACGHLLQTPMFFFLLNLALTDLGSILTTVPKAMQNSLWDTRNISYTGCAAQVFFFAFFIASEFAFLTIMCYDRYVSICKPLHYGTLLGSRACAHMAAAAWASGFLNALMHTANTFSLPLCHGNTLGQFFCEIPHILKLSCSHSKLRELGLLVITFCLTSCCFAFIVFSYVQIFRAVLRIPSEQGQHKAFSTCLPHLAVLSLFIITDTFVYLKPPSISSPAMDLMVSVLYSVVPPAVNPLIYSLRNQQLKESLRKAMTGCFSVFLFSPNSPPSVLQGTERSWKRTPGLTPAAQAWHSISSFSQHSASIESLRVAKEGSARVAW